MKHVFASPLPPNRLRRSAPFLVAIAVFTAGTVGSLAGSSVRNDLRRAFSAADSRLPVLEITLKAEKLSRIMRESEDDADATETDDLKVAARFEGKIHVAKLKLVAADDEAPAGIQIDLAEGDALFGKGSFRLVDAPEKDDSRVRLIVNGRELGEFGVH